MSRSEESSSEDEVRNAVSEIVRQEWSRVVASLLSDFRDLGEAEDAAQDAAEEALRRWPDNGIPDKPGAWLTVVGRRRAIDRLRRAAKGREKSEQLARLEDRHRSGTDADETIDVDANDSLLRDEQLRLIFGCCHPSLSPEAQMALTLRSVGGLTTTEIARAFLVPEPTLAQRLVRAKKKIAVAAVPFKIPPDAELLSRVDEVRTVLYLIYNQGYSYSDHTELRPTAERRQVVVDLRTEAIRLTRHLAKLTPDDAESLGLLSLFLSLEARRNARTDHAGGLVLLEEQDRSLWNVELAAEGEAALDRALRLFASGPYQIQAAINVLHNSAVSPSETDWEQIELLYRRLISMTPTPVVRLNHAIAVAMASDHARAVELLDAPDLAESLDSYHYYHAARAEFLGSEQADAARVAFDRSLELVTNEAERTILLRKRAALD